MLQMTAEQRRARRWGIFFKLLTFVYLFSLLLIFKAEVDPKVHHGGESFTAFVDVNGVIAAGEDANADDIVSGLRDAFDDPGTAAIIMRINSPGGSPVQAGYVYDEIKRLRQLHPDTKLYAVISDLGASGAYYIAAAADAIYADKASLVGSIGVVASGFGFVESMEKLGVERRTYTAGEHKAFLDPFSPQRDQEVDFWQSVLNKTHQQFIGKVKEGRGDRLKEDPLMFSGLVWSGEQALELGLIDGLGSAGFVAREIIGEENTVDFTAQPDAFEKFVQRMGTVVGDVIVNRVASSNLQLR
ncbi:MAG: S49 family peptidase [Hahellaceae bacterium]|nr:S49 family peptidase [Hahellaceae bacterium]